MTLPAFETPRFILRPIVESDAPGLHEAYGNAEAMQHWDHGVSPDVAATAARIRDSVAVDPRWHAMWAVHTRGGRFAGAVNYHAHYPPARRLAVGWIAVPSLWRQGVMTEAVPPLLAHCFTQMNVHRIEARIEPDNVASRRLAARLGFTEELGLLRDWLIVDGEFRSIVMYSLLESKWAARA